MTSKLMPVVDVPHRSLKTWKLGGKLRVLLCRISEVPELYLPSGGMQTQLKAGSFQSGKRAR
jgi:hypothetical protein